MDRKQLASFVDRDWALVESEEAAYWVATKARLPPGELFAIVERFRSEIRELRPDWPSEAERAADLDAHVELSRRLSSVHGHPRR